MLRIIRRRKKKEQEKKVEVELDEIILMSYTNVNKIGAVREAEVHCMEKKVTNFSPPRKDKVFEDE